MNILTPLNDIDSLETLIKSGCTEFYVGFKEEKWNERYGLISGLNRMSGFADAANKYDIYDLQEIAKRIHYYKCKIFITVNNNFYSSTQYDDLIPIFQKLKLFNVDGIIVSSLDLVYMCNKIGLKSVASTMCGIYNELILEQYINAGVSRVILPRDLTVSSIEYLVSKYKEKVEFEVFLMRNGCVYSDAYCLGVHKKDSLCGSLCASIKMNSFRVYKNTNYKCSKLEIINTNDIFCNRLLVNACGLCALKIFLDIGIKAVKIVGRADGEDNINRCAQLVNKNINIAINCTSHKDYLDKMYLPANHKRNCINHFSCYYPEICKEDF